MTSRGRIASKNSTKALALAVAALALVPASGVAHTAAPVTGTGQPGAIPGHYIVVMKSAASDASKERTKNRARARGARVDRDYGSALKGYAAMLPATALSDVRSDPDVAYVEADAIVSATTTQSAPPWGLDRIDQSSLPLNQAYSYTPAGAGVKAYIVDTGVRFSHQQFAGRAVSGYDAVDGGSADDCNGHGSHVAGTVGGSTYGVAKQVDLVGVRVLDCTGSGTNSGVIAGVNWVTGDHAAGQPAVANMSLGGGTSTALDQAVANSIADGVSYAVAAGNENADACLGSPARAASAITVASTTSTDARSSFSNFGTCVDLFAPGSSIKSSWYTSDTATNTISGTSMATPHVAGVAALYLQSNPTASPGTVADAVHAGATAGKVTDAGTGSPNRLLSSGLGVAPPPPAPTGWHRASAVLWAQPGRRRLHPTGRPTSRSPPVRTAVVCADLRQPTSTCTSTSAPARAGRRSRGRSARHPATTSPTAPPPAHTAGASCHTAAAARTRSSSRSRTDLTRHGLGAQAPSPRASPRRGVSRSPTLVRPDVVRAAPAWCT
ncbi:MAG: S8 family serine peptidase [Solirubrobacteraceae bacterium]